MSAGNSEKTFWGHLDDLRKVLFKMVAVLIVFTAVSFVYMRDIFDRIILGPCHGDFILYRLFAKITGGIPGLPQFDTGTFEVKIINTGLASQFFTHISSSFWFALICACPFLLYFLWSFISPALYDKEKRGARTAFLLGTIMFYLGVAICYFVIFPVTLRFLYEYQLSSSIDNLLSLDSYMSNFTTMHIVIGLVFELPLVAWALSAAGILRRAFFRRYRRHAIVVLLILAAIITPTGDPFTLAIVFLPLYLLYELSALIVKK